MTKTLKLTGAMKTITTLEALCSCPSCGARAIVALTPSQRLDQSDNTTHVCHPTLGGCNHGWADDRLDDTARCSPAPVLTKVMLVQDPATVELTALQRDVLAAMYRSEYGDGDTPCPWSWSITEHCHVARPEQVSGVITALVRKGLIYTGGMSKKYKSEDAYCGVTALGFAVAKLNGLTERGDA